jgi:hypothetical protein
VDCFPFGFIFALARDESFLYTPVFAFCDWEFKISILRGIERMNEWQGNQREEMKKLGSKSSDRGPVP